MAAIKGRSLKVHRNGVLVAGVRTKSITVNGAPIDITNDDDDGIKKLLDAPASVEVTIAVSGILINDALRTEALASTSRVATTTFTVPGSPGSPDHVLFSGSFFLTNYAEAGEHEGAATFEAEFQSAGAVTLT